MWIAWRSVVARPIVAGVSITVIMPSRPATTPELLRHQPPGGCTNAQVDGLSCWSSPEFSLVMLVQDLGGAHLVDGEDKQPQSLPRRRTVQGGAHTWGELA